MSRTSKNQLQPLGRFLPAAVATGLLILLWTVDTYGWVRHEWTFWAATAGIVAYVCTECWMLWRSDDARWLVAPPVLISGMTFILNFAGSNVVYLLLPPSRTGLGRYGIYDFHWMSRSMLITAAGLIAMWVGYKLVVGRQFGAWLRAKLRGTPGFRRSFEPSWPIVFAFFGVSATVRILTISAGLFGYVGSVEKKQSFAAVIQYIGLLGDLSILSLVVVGLFAFSKKHESLAPYLVLAGFVAVEIAFGLLSGYKNKVVYPAIIVGICLYVARGDFPWKWLVATVGLIVVSYAVVEPLRDIAWETGKSELHDVETLTETVSGIATGDVKSGRDRSAEALVFEFLNRQNLLVRCAVAVRAYDSGRIPEARTRFQRDMAMSPIYAIIPRLIWPSKPKQRLGTWFNDVVLGARGHNAVGMSGIGYLYVAGGIPMIVGFMLVLGVFGRALQNGVLYAGAGGVVLFLVIMGFTAKIPQPTYQLVVKLIRLVPLVFFVQFMVFRR